MRTILLAAAAFALSTSPLLADDIMATRYGNTVISTDPGGVQNKTYYNADRTFTGMQGTEAFKGTWKLDAGNVCLTFDSALPDLPKSFCVPVSMHKVGDVWPGRGTTVTLVQGIQ
jgi:hypothetical protein